MNKKNVFLTVAVLITFVIAVGGYYFPQVGNVLGSVGTRFQHGLAVGSNATVSTSGQFVIGDEGSPDGFVLWDDFTIGTTTPVRASMVNNTGLEAMCDGDSLYVYSDSKSTTLGPSFAIAVGTASGATLYSANLLASTTIATTTDTVTAGASAPFLLSNGSYINLAVGDNGYNTASSTYYGTSYWTGQVGVHCWTLGQ